MFKIIFAIALLGAHAAFAGGTVPNGGDMALCKGEPFSKDQDEAHYSYDYVAGLVEGFPWAGYVQDENLTGFNARILDILGRASKDLKRDYAEFLKSAETFWRVEEVSASKKSKRVWRFMPPPANGNNVFIPEGLLAPQCRTQPAFPGFYLMSRLVERSQLSDGRIHYWANRIRFQKMISEKPLQGSIVLVHEWLWDHFSNATKSRQVNLFLHSQKAAEMKDEDLRVHLMYLGL